MGAPLHLPEDTVLLDTLVEALQQVLEALPLVGSYEAQTGLTPFVVETEANYIGVFLEVSRKVARPRFMSGRRLRVQSTQLEGAQHRVHLKAVRSAPY